MIKSPLNKIDEFSQFSEALNQMASQRGDMNEILIGLTAAQNEQLKLLVKTKRIVLNSQPQNGGGQANGVEGQNEGEARTILKARRKFTK